MTIRDIASLANVSVATVSKIINHKDSEISDETRRRVLGVIKEYQYTPYANLKASMEMGRSQLIAFITQEKLYDAEFVFCVEKNISQLGYSLLLCNLREPFSDNLRKYMGIIEARKAEAVLLGISSPDLLQEAVSLNYSQLPMGAIVPFSSDICTTFHLDYRAGTELAVSELVQLGHTKIACVLDDSEPLCKDAVISGYKNALMPFTQYGTEYYILENNVARPVLTKNVQKLLLAKITGFFCQTASVANVVYEILKESEYYIPNHVSVICGEPPQNPQYFNPPLTCSVLPIRDIITAAVEYLVNAIESRSFMRISRYTFAPVLIPGGSIAPSVSTGKPILVVGNCSTDINLRLPKIPAGEELISVNDHTVIPGGKATVQAVGAGKLGGTVYILGCVGNDVEGSNIIDSLKNAYVHVEGLTTFASMPTGKAYILIPDSGNSSIIAYPGVNAVYTIEHLRAFGHLFQTCDYCLLSTELNEELVSYVINKCEKYQTEILLKPSSIDFFPDEYLSKVTYMIPNQHELNHIFPGPLSYQEKADILYQKGCPNIIVTLGRKGCYLKNREYSIHIPAANFRSVDSTGAANCFISAMAVSMSKGNPLLYALCYATYAAGISTMNPGVQTSFPDRYQLEMYVDEIQNLYHSLLHKMC